MRHTPEGGLFPEVGCVFTLQAGLAVTRLSDDDDHNIGSKIGGTQGYVAFGSGYRPTYDADVGECVRLTGFGG